MTDNIDLKHYWKKRPIIIPEKDEIIQKANSYKKKVLFRLIAANLALISTSSFIAFIWYYYQPVFITTKIGILLCIIDMILYMAIHNTLVPLILKKPKNLNIKEQLKRLRKLKEKQHFQQTTLLNIYFVVLYVGLGLYMYEYASRMTTAWAIISYLVILFWILLNAFYFRPRAARKQRDRLDQLVSQVNRLKEQLEE